MNNRTVLRIVEAIRAGNATFMLGAGISMFRRSACPGWQAMVSEIINVVAGDAIPNPLNYIKPHLGLLFNETFFQIMYRTLTAEQTFAVIHACLDAPHASRIHRFVAWAANHFDAQILTSNFDELIERSGLRSRRQIRKLHGTLAEPETLRFTANTVFAPLAPQLASATHRFLGGRTLIVAGYGGWDVHDIMPVLFQQKSPVQQVIWIHFPGDPPAEQVRGFFTADTLVVSANVDQVFQKVYRQLAKESGHYDDELARWGRDDEHCDDRDWWIRNVAAWAAEVCAHNPERMRLLWARLVDHVRLYQINIDGMNRNLADEAYESIKRLREPALRYEAQARAAYMGRTMGRSRNAARDLRRIIGKLRNEIDAAQNSRSAEELPGLLGWCMHQRGVALQGDGRFRDADVQLSDAITFRVKHHDPDVWFSEFQRYMNCRRALEEGIVICRDFHDLTWQRSFATQLDVAAEQFRAAYKMDDYAQTLHNSAFVYQSMAEDAHREGQRHDMIGRYAERSLQRYQAAASIRESLRDPRMIAQSKLRLGQVEVLRAMNQITSPADVDPRIAQAESAVSRARGYAAEVSAIYSSLPQENFRVTHVNHVIEDCDKLMAYQLNDQFCNWLPQRQIARVTDFDDAACDLRRIYGWHLGVLTAVFDQALRRVLLVHLGEYARDESGKSPWVLPGGAVEPLERPSEAAIRELSEETGLLVKGRRLRPAGWFPRPDFRPHGQKRKGELLLLFALQLDDQVALHARPPEITAAKFVSVNLSAMRSAKTHEHLGGPLPTRHVYWSRMAQAALRWKLQPRLFIYRQDNTSMAPWLNLERPAFETEIHFD